MLTQRKDGQETRQRLLDAACEVFAANGFRQATVAEICREADANIAAANYHFGGKEALYVETWRYALEKSLRTHPSDGGVAADAPPEERLRGRILSIMQRIVDPKSYDFDIVHKEIANPTGLLTDAMHESLGPLRRDFVAMVRELLGEKVTEQQVRLCHMSIMAQCFGPLLRERRRKKSSRGSHARGHEPLGADVKTLADHVTRFSLAGIREISQGGSRHPRRRKRSR